jgi:hypothetical protein
MLAIIKDSKDPGDLRVIRTCGGCAYLGSATFFGTPLLMMFIWRKKFSFIKRIGYSVGAGIFSSAVTLGICGMLCKNALKGLHPESPLAKELAHLRAEADENARALETAHEAEVQRLREEIRLKKARVMLSEPPKKSE